MEKPKQISSSSKEIAKNLLDIGAIQINVKTPFTWVSGIKSPIYCDNRKINSNVEVRKNAVNAFISIIEKHFHEVKIIAGVATGGIPLGVLIADRMNLPFIYVRQEQKKYGLMKQVEGDCKVGDKVVLIEDLISTGSSSLKAVRGLRNAELNLLGLISIMTYNFDKAIDLFKKENVNHFSLCDLDTILEVALDRGSINSIDRDSILSFRSSPETWVK